MVTLTFGDTTVDAPDIEDFRIEGPQGAYINGQAIITGILSVDTIASRSTDTNLALSGNGTGIVQVNDNLDLVANSLIGTSVSLTNANLQYLDLIANANAGLNALTTVEVNQLETIGAATITSAQWLNVGAMNQNVATSSVVSFAQVTVDNLVINANTISSSTGNINISAASNVSINKTLDMNTQIVTNVSTLRTSNGTAGLPAHTFSGDLDNGMYLAGTNILSFATAGAQRMRLSAAGELFAYDLDGITDAAMHYDTVTNEIGFTLSSKKYKTDIKSAIFDLGELSDKFSKLSPKFFRFKTNKPFNPSKLGLIAEDVEKLFPEIISYKKDAKEYILDDKGNKIVSNYDERGLLSIIVELINYYARKIDKIEQAVFV